jgi:hypothetical protein
MAFHVAEFHGPNALAISPATHQFRQFRSRKYQSHDDKLDRKVSAIQHNTDAALRLLGPLGDGYATAIAVSAGLIVPTPGLPSVRMTEGQCQRKGTSSGDC